MSYLSTKEVSKLWGISTARIVKLASEGRIFGAKLVGNSWLIPQNAAKPEDGRTKSVKKYRNEPSYHFPLFLIGNYDTEEKASLSKEEQLLFEAQLLAESSKTDEAVIILEKLTSSSKNRYVLIGAYASLCYIYILTNNCQKYESMFLQLQLLFAEEFPHKEELRFLLIDLQSMLEGHEILNHFSISPLISYSTEAQIFGITMSSYVTTITNPGDNYQNLSVYELNCRRLAENGYYFAEMYLHFFLSLSYFSSRAEYVESHLRQAISIAVNNNYYMTLSTLSTFNYPPFLSVLNEFPQNIRDAFIRLHDNNSYGKFLRSSGKTSLYTLLDPQDYCLINYALSKMFNKQIAECEGVTEGTINKRYAKLYEKMHVKNKAELVGLCLATMNRLDAKKL